MSKAISNRLKRIEGQITKLENQITQGEACDEVVPQFLADTGALNAAFLAYLKESIASCQSSDPETLEALLAHLLK